MPPAAERVIKMYRAGRPTRSIAAALGLTLGQVSGILFRWREREGIAARQPVVHTVWTSATISLLHQMRAAGYSIPRCARELGVDESTVKRRLRREALGEPKPLPRPPRKRAVTRVQTPRPIPAPKPEPLRTGEQPASRQPKAPPGRRSCLWPMWPHGARRGRPLFNTFCGCIVSVGPYCADHASIAYRAEAA